MTRINTILATDLTDQHLFAEYREITRIFALVAAACQKHSVPAILTKIPANYRMGAGHVLFFMTNWLLLSGGILPYEMKCCSVNLKSRSKTILWHFAK